MPHWNGIVDCQVLASNPIIASPIAGTRRAKEAASGLKTLVTWTLTPTKGGVLLRMEQLGFRPEDEANYQGASYGWQWYIGGLERVAAGLG